MRENSAEDVQTKIAHGMSTIKKNYIRNKHNIFIYPL